MKLNHTIKVAVRRALKALKSADHQLNISEAKITTQLIHEIDERLVANKAGFRTRADLEAFAKKHRLL